MGIGIGNMGIGYNSFTPGYAASRIPSVSVEEVKKQDLQKQAEQMPMDSSVKQSGAQAPAEVRRETAPRQAELEDISLTFNKQDNFGYIGKDSDINKLDMEKAISDMQKDKVLQQYNYFVGSSKNLMENNPDGTVIAKW